MAIKTAEQQARGMLFRTRDLLVRQRTQTINALRGHLAEFGVVAAQGPAHVDRLAPALEDPDSGLPDAVRELGSLLLEQIVDFTAKIEGCQRRRDCALARRRKNVPLASAVACPRSPWEGPARGTTRPRRDAARLNCRGSRLRIPTDLTADSYFT